MNLSDPQLSNQEWQEGRAEGRNLTKTVTCLINKVKPDLITVSGDLAWAGHFESYEHLADLLDGFGIPWAPVFGNHDNQGGAEQVEKAAEILRQRKHCLLYWNAAIPPLVTEIMSLALRKKGIYFMLFS